LQAIGDARIAIEEALMGTVEEPIARPDPAHRTGSRVLGTIAALLGVATITLGVAFWRSARSGDRPLIRLNVDLGPDSAPSRLINAVISPDGTWLVYFVKGSDGNWRLATRVLDQNRATILAGTEGAEWPFFSANGQWIGFSLQIER
jgi:hypothetical protein